MEWNGMEWNGMEWNGLERNRTKQNETERNRMKQNETERNSMKHTRTVSLCTEQNGAEREEEIEIELKRKRFSISLHAQTERNGMGTRSGVEWRGNNEYLAMFPSLSKTKLELGKNRCVPIIVSRSGAERRTVKE